MKYSLTIIIAFLITIEGVSQSSYSFDPDTIILEKTADFEFFYDYTQFENHTNDTLFMRWKKVYIDLSDGHGGALNWGVSIQDPNNFYNPGNTIDSADFFLPPTTTSSDKFIVQVYPNGIVGNMTAKFIFYPINNPSDTGSVYFDYSANTPPTSVKNLLDEEIEINPNPAVDFFEIKNHKDFAIRFQLLDIHGKRLQEGFIEKKSNQILATEAMMGGVYFLVFESKTQKIIRKILIQK